jgi:hypothetical protein
MSLPRNLTFDRKITASYAKCYKSNIQPQNGTSGYNLGDTITINIPTRMGLNMDTLNSGLKFALSLTAPTIATTTRWDSCGAHGLIQRLVVKHGSNIWDDINNYGQVVKDLFDLQVPFSGNYGKNNILTGTRNDLVLSGANQVRQVNSGEILFDNTAAANTTVTRYYFLNLVSIVGALCNQNYLPNWGFTSASIVIEITLVDNLKKALATEADLTFSMTNIEYVASFVELNPQAMDIVLKANNGRVELPYTSLKNFNTSFTAANNGQYTIPIAAKYTSLKGIICSQRNTALTGVVGYYPYSSCVNGLTQYQFRVGSNVLPSKPVDNIVEMFSEVCKVFGSIGDIQYNPNIEYDSYNFTNNVINAVATRYASNSGSFYIGIDLEAYPSADKSKMYAGWDSRTDDIYLNITYGTVSFATARWDIFVFFDQTLISEMGTGYVQY